MKGAERDEALLRYIQESIARIGQYTRGGREALLAEPMIQDATLRRLETLADAASRLSGEFESASSGDPLGGRSPASATSPLTTT